MTRQEFINAGIKAGHSEDALHAYINYNLGDHGSAESLGLELSKFEDQYVGKYDDDETFARETAEQLGTSNLIHWPYSCIDWEQAATELMMDYYEEKGHYFRA